MADQDQTNSKALAEKAAADAVAVVALQGVDVATLADAPPASSGDVATFGGTPDVAQVPQVNPILAQMQAIQQAEEATLGVQLRPEAVLGSRMRLSSVGERRQHPFTKVWFEEGAGRLVEVDGWVKLQYDGKRLQIEE